MSTPVTPQRVLACVSCQQRKVKCDRKFPCANCRRAGTGCVPAALVQRQRRRRFPEKELLERLRHYEGLLRQNNIKFEPLHGEVKEQTPGPSDQTSTSDDAGSPSESRNGTRLRPSNIWQAMSQRPADEDSEDDENDNGFLNGADDLRVGVIKKAWDRMYERENSDPLLFGSLNTDIDLSTLHPEQSQIFKLWQFYLENVNPLLKVTHTPTLQARIVNSVGNLGGISPELEALIFSMYCVALMSLDETACTFHFASEKKYLLGSYQFACRQALLKCGVLRTTDRDCLTALFLYLVSVRPDTDPRCLSSLLAVAIRTAQRMGLHNESSYAKHTALEGEMRRRLWWALVIFDHRVCEMTDNKTTMLSPMWNCKPPLNINDFEIQAEMKTAPVAHDRPTEALFSVVRSEITDFIRRSTFHLEFTKTLIPDHLAPTRVGVSDLEKMIEEKYLVYCNEEILLQYMTAWTARGQIAKLHLMEHYSKQPLPEDQSDHDRNTAFSYALRMLECDTKVLSSPLVKLSFIWFTNFSFPFPGYVHILQDLKKRPGEGHAEKAWKAMSDNYEARFMNSPQMEGPLFTVFSRLVLQAWDATERWQEEQRKELGASPMIVMDVRSRVGHMVGKFGQNGSSDNLVGMNGNNAFAPAPGDPGAGFNGNFAGPGMWGFSGQAGIDFGMDIRARWFDWASLS